MFLREYVWNLKMFSWKYVWNLINLRTLPKLRASSRLFHLRWSIHGNLTQSTKGLAEEVVMALKLR